MMDYVKLNRVKLVAGLIGLFLLLQVYKFINIRIINLDLPKGKIVFSSGLRGHNEIYLMNLNGTNLRRATSYSLFGRTFANWFSDFRPSFSYDGRKIVFDSDRDDKRPKMRRAHYPGGIVRESSLPVFDEIYIMNLSDRVTVRLTHNQSRYRSPVFSPDGQKILFYSIPFPQDPFYEELRMIYFNGSGERVLGRGHNVSLLSKFSPDSRKIYFIFRGDLHSIDIYGKIPIRLTYFNLNNVERPNKVEKVSFIDNFVLSPDGSEVVLVTTERDALQFIFYRMNTSDSKLREIARLGNTDRLGYSGYIPEMKYSPNGEKVAFIADFGTPKFYMLDKNNKFNFIRNLNKTDSGVEDVEGNRFTFTPDSKRVLFIASFPYGPSNDLVTWAKSFVYETFIRFNYYILRRIRGAYDNKYLCIMDLEKGNFRKIARIPISLNNFGRDFVYWEK